MKDTSNDLTREGIAALKAVENILMKYKATQRNHSSTTGNEKLPLAKLHPVRTG